MKDLMSDIQKEYLLRGYDFKYVFFMAPFNEYSFAPSLVLLFNATHYTIFDTSVEFFETPESIGKIYFDGIFLRDINFFRELDRTNIRKIILSNCMIKDASPFLDCEFTQLEILCLDYNFVANKEKKAIMEKFPFASFKDF